MRSLSLNDDNRGEHRALLNTTTTTTTNEFDEDWKRRQLRRVKIVSAFMISVSVLLIMSTNTKTSERDMRAKKVFRLGASPLTLRNLREIFNSAYDFENPADPVVSSLKRDNLFNVRTFPERTAEYLGDLHLQIGADDSWYHKPIKGVTDENEGKFKMCLMGGIESWDMVYVDNANTLTEPGLCFSEVVDVDTNAHKGGYEDCDVRVFNQGAFLWGRRYRDDLDEDVFKPPPKANANQVDFYYAHEAANHFGKELADPKSVKNMDYMATFAMKDNAIWYTFGPSIEHLIANFQSFVIPREERVPAVAYLGLDCMPSRAGVLNEISKVFPVASIGGCAHNFEKPEGDPGRGGSPKEQNTYLAPFMFYFSVENGISCPDYITEKLWGALARGSIPVYFGWPGIEEYLPSVDAIIDLRNYPTPESLAEKLRLVATNDDAYNQMHAWRYEDPYTWPLAFRNLIREVSEDMKGSLCNVLKAGPTPQHPRAKVQGYCADGSHSIEEFHDGTGLETATMFGSKVSSFQYQLKTEESRPDEILIGRWEDLMEKRCDELNGRCYVLKDGSTLPPLIQQYALPEPELAQQAPFQSSFPIIHEEQVNEVISVEPVLAMEETPPTARANCNAAEPCIAGVPVPGIGCCSAEERTRQIQWDMEHVQQQQQQQQQPELVVVDSAAAAVSPVPVVAFQEAVAAAATEHRPNCNAAEPCIAGVPVAGIGCCTADQRTRQIQWDAEHPLELQQIISNEVHRAVEVLEVPLPQPEQQQQPEQPQPQQQQQQQQGKHLSVPLDCNPDPACVPLTEIVPNVMDCCAPEYRNDIIYPVVIDVVVSEPEPQPQQQQQQSDVSIAQGQPQWTNSQQPVYHLTDVEKTEADRAQSLLHAQAQEQQLPSEADARFEQRPFVWGPGHQAN
jgi:hypothetical protein